MSDIMIDLETLGTRPGSVILSIGAVRFGSEGITDPFYLVINEANSRSHGLTVDQHTLDWWNEQTPQARAVLEQARDPGAPELGRVLEELALYIQPDDRVWGNGASFDNVLLAEAFRVMGFPLPWKFYNDRCYRTVKNLYPGVLFGGVKGVAHNALDDARAQAEHMVRIGALVGRTWG